MSSTVIERVVNELAGLPAAAQEQVLDFILVLKTTHPQAPRQPANGDAARYPLRGEAYTYIEPFAPVLPPGMP